tara:strand:- start:13020 stop:13193 length:174 start_codon:yes stop_codon:yes gene_type:complete
MENKIDLLEGKMKTIVNDLKELEDVVVELSNAMMNNTKVEKSAPKKAKKETKKLPAL